VRVTFVENEDSFTWNVVDLLPFSRGEVRLVRGGTAEARAACEGADAVVVGPGPMDPARAGLVELVREVVERRTPLLGICLGHQALGLAFGAKLVRSTPAHGKRAVARFSGATRFPGLEGAFEVMRYHSLSLSEVPPPLRVVAALEDGTPMAVEHAHARAAGLQFHPDSHGTPEGRAMIEAFFRGLS
jgi:anthranilate synthase/aminodeoxychorismate synthase-like glutamine amidotransferase